MTATVAVVSFGLRTADMFDQAKRDPDWKAIEAEVARRGYTLRTTQRLGTSAELAPFSLVFNVPICMRQRTQSKLSRRLRHRFKMAFDSDYSFTSRRLAGSLQSKTVLIAFEPPTVIPEHSQEHVLRRFGAVLTWSPELAALGPQFFLMRLHYRPSGEPAAVVPFTDRKLMGAFVGNKSSAHPAELYGERRAVIDYMEATAPEDFDFFGRGWSGEQICWRGVANDKHRASGNYRFVLCYENSRGTAGYISEKILDCLVAGAVPVYWGAPDIGRVVDPDAFVDREKFASTADLIRYLRGVSEPEWCAMRHARCGCPVVGGGWLGAILAKGVCRRDCGRIGFCGQGVVLVVNFPEVVC